MLRAILILVSALRSVTGYYNGGNNNYYKTYGTSSLKFSSCDNSVVRMSFLSISCDSPYTFYYGYGANRNAEVCDYGDKVKILGTVTVVDNLQYGDHIYMTLGIYDDDSNLLVNTRPTDFCEDYIGSECTRQGTYSFETNLKLGFPEGKNRTHFYPLLQIAFSTKLDYGYNLGAVNMQCQGRDNNGLMYAAWGNKKTQLGPGEKFFTDNAILIIACFSLSVFALYVWKKAEQEGDEIALAVYEDYDMEGNLGDYHHRDEGNMALKK